MASERKQQANRNNAMRSTGPRTERGKLRAKLNALRHGLATKQAAFPEIERMAKAICGRGASRLQYEEALNVAESQFVLLAVRDARVVTIKRMMTGAPTPKEQVAILVSRRLRARRKQRPRKSRRRRLRIALTPWYVRCLS